MRNSDDRMDLNVRVTTDALRLVLSAPTEEEVSTDTLFGILFEAAHDRPPSETTELFDWVNSVGREQAELHAAYAEPVSQARRLRTCWPGIVGLPLSVLEEMARLPDGVWQRPDLPDHPYDADWTQILPLFGAYPALSAAESIVEAVPRVFRSQEDSRTWFTSPNAHLLDSTPELLLREGRWDDVYTAMKREQTRLPVPDFEPVHATGLASIRDLIRERRTNDPVVNAGFPVPRSAFDDFLEGATSYRVGHLLPVLYRNVVLEVEMSDTGDSTAPPYERRVYPDHWLIPALWWLGMSMSEVASLLGAEDEGELQRWRSGPSSWSADAEARARDLAYLGRRVRSRFNCDQRAAGAWFQETANSGGPGIRGERHHDLFARGHVRFIAGLLHPLPHLLLKHPWPLPAAEDRRIAEARDVWRKSRDERVVSSLAAALDRPAEEVRDLLDGVRLKTNSLSFASALESLLERETGSV